MRQYMTRVPRTGTTAAWRNCTTFSAEFNSTGTLGRIVSKPQKTSAASADLVLTNNCPATPQPHNRPSLRVLAHAGDPFPCPFN